MGLQARRAKLTAAVAAFERERAAVGTVALPPGTDDIAREWPALTPIQQRNLLRSAIRCVFVRGSRRTAPLDGRLHLVWQGEDIALPIAVGTAGGLSRSSSRKTETRMLCNSGWRSWRIAAHVRVSAASACGGKRVNTPPRASSASRSSKRP